MLPGCLRAGLGRTPAGISDAPGVRLAGRAAKYSAAVCQLNEAVASRQPFDAVAQFAAACADDTGPPASRLCNPLVAMLRSAPGLNILWKLPIGVSHLGTGCLTLHARVWVA